MLLEFSTENYKSFAEKMTFSMTPAPKQKGLDYSVFSEAIGNKRYKGLCSAVIYGPNAAGKTNIIGAIDTMKSVVLSGNINNKTVLSLNHASSSLELIPNCNVENKPTVFRIRFTEEGFLIDYSFTADLGDFLNKDYKRKIISESLYVNEKIIFTRNGDLSVNIPGVIKNYVGEYKKDRLIMMSELAKKSLNDTELFLNNGFKNIFSKEFVSIILNWFSNKLTIVYRSDAIRLLYRKNESDDIFIYLNKTLTDAAKAFGLSSNALGFKSAKKGEENDNTLYSLFKNKNIAVPAEVFESYGTIRFINEFPLIVKAIMEGGTLIMDEFDASIHPTALMNIINIFHNDDINKNHAQLIFDTHNPIFLNSDLFRRDEIKFVERDEKTGDSVHYSLSDFKTYNVRKGEDYMKNYFVNRYGAVNYVDFSPLFEELSADNGVTNNESKT